VPERWLTIDDRKSAFSSPAGQAANSSDALREANKRIMLLEQRNEVLRRAAAYLSQANLPGKWCTRSSASWPSMGSPSR
jgi:transposase